MSERERESFKGAAANTHQSEPDGSFCVCDSEFMVTLAASCGPPSFS